MTRVFADTFFFLPRSPLPPSPVTGHLPLTTGHCPSRRLGAVRCSWKLADSDELCRFERAPGEISERGGEITLAPGMQQTHDSVTQRGQELRRVAAAHTASVLAQGHVAHVMRAVLDVPMPTPHPQQTPCPSLPPRQAGDRKRHGRARLLAATDRPLQPTHLLQPRPVHCVLAAIGRPQAPPLAAPPVLVVLRRLMRYDLPQLLFGGGEPASRTPPGAPPSGPAGCLSPPPGSRRLGSPLAHRTPADRRPRRPR